MTSEKRSGGFLKGAIKYRVASETTHSAIRSFLSSLSCPRSLTVWLLYESGEHEQLANLEFQPKNYQSIGDLRDAYAATKFLSKYKDLTLAYDKEKRAVEKFMKYESQCKQTNGLFRDLAHHPQYTGDVVWLHHAITRKIAWILGDFVPEEFDRWPDWGPGATTLVKRLDASIPIKFQKETGITRDLFDLFPLAFLREIYPRWGEHLESIGFPTLQIGNKVITVPKDATIDRVIAVEPGLNLWFQKSLGKIIKSRLSRVGVDLKHQSVNQKLARLGSIDQCVATVDMSSASDSISKSVVQELLPYDWFSILDSCRSHYGNVNGEWLRWEKFSSMGNGFTFQLESLIFYAIALCCVEYQHADMFLVSVYGDDVILPTSVFALFQRMLGFYGFTVNTKKSHYDSTFRESCGAHYVRGIDVKPLYLKGKLNSILSVYRLANAVRRLAHRRNSSQSCDLRLRASFESLVQSVPLALRLRIPDHLGDSGFISCLDEATPKVVRNNQRTLQWEGWSVSSLAEVRETYQEERNGYLLASLWRLSKLGPKFDFWPWNKPSMLEAIRRLDKEDSEDLGENRVPAGPLKLRLTKGVVTQWLDLGPWEILRTAQNLT